MPRAVRYACALAGTWLTTAVGWGALVVLGASSARAGITYSVSFDDPTGSLDSVRALIEQHVLAAGARWNEFLAGDAAIEVVVRSTTSVPFAEELSLTSSFVGQNGALNVFEQGMAAEIRTGTDPNGAAPDVEIQINPDYAVNELWYDPAPAVAVSPRRLAGAKGMLGRAGRERIARGCG